jgi:hypothetical protein
LSTGKVLVCRRKVVPSAVRLIITCVVLSIFYHDIVCNEMESGGGGGGIEGLEVGWGGGFNRKITGEMITMCVRACVRVGRCV